jgi:N-acetylneuraminic acid mutarotase
VKAAVFGWLLLVFSVVAYAEPIQPEALPPLSQAVSNNAVTLVSTDKGNYLYSFLGLGSGKTWQDILSAAFVLEPGAKTWMELDPVPGTAGRLAASAVSVGGAAWLFGGYTVAADGSEQSTAGVYRIRPGESALQWVTDMPVPVEDSVVLAYKDRFIYLISGWHDLGNVNLVQVLDTKTMQWAQATPWPGEPVFGHAGGIHEGRLLVCDGVKIQYPADDSPREFLPSGECWLGSIDTQNHRKLSWKKVAHHPGAARYRMAATGNTNAEIVFAGGSVNPYNFNGIGYNGEPAETESSVFSFNLISGEWRNNGHLAKGKMDHRGLLFSDGWYYLIGGMHAEQKPVTDVFRFRIDGL